MNRKTNVFYLSGNDSKFLTFDNYTDALTGDIIATNQKLWPSRFLCVNIKNFNRVSSPDLTNEEKREEFVAKKSDFIKNYLVQYYENKLAFLRDNLEESKESNLTPLTYLLEIICLYGARNNGKGKTIDSIESLEKDLYRKYRSFNINKSKELMNYIKEEYEVDFCYIGDIVEQDYNGTYADIICTITPNNRKLPLFNIDQTRVNEIENEDQSIEYYIDYDFRNYENPNKLFGWNSSVDELYIKKYLNDITDEYINNLIDKYIYNKYLSVNLKDIIYYDIDAINTGNPKGFVNKGVFVKVKDNTNELGYKYYDVLVKEPNDDSNIYTLSLNNIDLATYNLTTESIIIKNESSDEIKNILYSDGYISTDGLIINEIKWYTDIDVKISYIVNKINEYLDSEEQININDNSDPDEIKTFIGKIDNYINQIKIDKIIFDHISEEEGNENKYFINPIINSIIPSENPSSLDFNIIIPLFDSEYITGEEINESLNEIEISRTKSVPLGIYFSDKNIVLDNDINGYSSNWSLLISTQFKSFPYSYNITHSFDDSDNIKNAYITFAEILSKQTNFIDLLNKYNDTVLGLANRIATLESAINNISSVQNIDELYQNFINLKFSVNTSLENLQSQIDSLKDSIEESKLKWKIKNND